MTRPEMPNRRVSKFFHPAFGVFIGAEKKCILSQPAPPPKKKSLGTGQAGLQRGRGLVAPTTPLCRSPAYVG